MFNDQLIQPGTEREFVQALDIMADIGADINTHMNASNKIRAVVDNFFHAPVKAQRAKIKAYATSTDFPQPMTPDPSVWQATDNFDMGWEQAFTNVPVADGHGFFEIATLTGIANWALTPEGSAANVDKFSGSLVQVPMITVSAGLGWTLQMIQDRRLAVMFDRAREFRSRYWRDKANRHYALLKAVGLAVATPWDTTGASTLEKDIITLNNAHYNLTFPLIDAGLGDDLANAEVILYASPLYRGRINRALRQDSQYLATSQIEVPIRPFYTFNTNIPSGAKALMVLPGRKLQAGEKMAPTTYAKTDIFTLSYVETVFARYGAGSGANQATQIALA